MIRIRGTPIQERDAAELAQDLRAYSAAGENVADRLDRALLMGTGMLGMSTTEAWVLLAVLEGRKDDRLHEIQEELRQFIR